MPCAFGLKDTFSYIQQELAIILDLPDLYNKLSGKKFSVLSSKSNDACV